MKRVRGLQHVPGLLYLHIQFGYLLWIESASRTAQSERDEAGIFECHPDPRVELPDQICCVLVHTRTKAWKDGKVHNHHFVIA